MEIIREVYLAMDINTLKTLCPLPWNNLVIGTTGTIQPCCVFGSHISNNSIELNISKNTVREIYYSDQLIEIRRQFLKGIKPTDCHICWDNENNDLTSTRQRHRTELISDRNLNIKNIIENKSAEIVSLDINVGNKCNFKCVMCSSEYSSRIAHEELSKYSKDSFEYKRLKQINKMGRWFEDESVWQNLEKVAPSLRYLDIFGGEPFLVHHQFKFLDYLITKGFAKNIKIHYNTNGSIFPECFFERWNHFKEVNIAFSIDNIGNKFESERYGSTWETVTNNITAIMDKSEPHYTFSIMVTHHILNILNLPDVLQWYETTGISDIHFAKITNPKYLQLAQLTQPAQEEVIKSLLSISDNRLIKYKVHDLINYIKHAGYNNNNTEFITAMREIDSIRDKRIIDSHTKIAHLMGYY